MAQVHPQPPAHSEAIFRREASEYHAGTITTDQLLRLRALGCNGVQGFLLSPPRPAEELATLFAGADPLR